jgi:GMP synthase (glutamine-hydrolysing)
VHYTQIPKNLKPSALIITGSKKRILREPLIPELNNIIHKTSGPVIGICYGFQYLALLDGGKIEENQVAYRGIKSGHHYNHYDKVVALPRSWTVLEKEDDFISVAKCKNWIGYQFHPEKKHIDFDKYIVSII